MVGWRADEFAARPFTYFLSCAAPLSPVFMSWPAWSLAMSSQQHFLPSAFIFSQQSPLGGAACAWAIEGRAIVNAIAVSSVFMSFSM